MLKCILLFSLLFLLSCGNDGVSNAEFQSTPIDDEITNADLIRSPVAADGLMDTINVAKIRFAETDYNFGTVKAGEVIEKEFTFTNTGKVPLLITDARSTCGCTVAERPTELIAPGEEGSISVAFDTKNKIGNQVKPVTIIANTYPVKSTVRMLGIVEE